MNSDSMVGMNKLTNVPLIIVVKFNLPIIIPGNLTVSAYPLELPSFSRYNVCVGELRSFSAVVMTLFRPCAAADCSPRMSISLERLSCITLSTTYSSSSF